MNFLLFLFLAISPLAGAISEQWDPAGMLLLKLATIVALVLLNGFFVAAEFALVKVRGSQLDSLKTEGNRRAAVARQVISNLDAYLSACQLGITLASLGLGWLGEPFLAVLLESALVSVGIVSHRVVSLIALGV